MQQELIKKLFDCAKNQLHKAYCPYSHFRVGAAILMDDENIYSGCNVENASYGATICAERTAITKAVSEGAKLIQTILITTSSDELIPPCGVCRQVISEFSNEKTSIVIANSETNFKSFTLQELLPFAFTKEQL